MKKFSENGDIKRNVIVSYLNRQPNRRTNNGFSEKTVWNIDNGTLKVIDTEMAISTTELNIKCEGLYPILGRKSKKKNEIFTVLYFTTR